jgi:Collagen triple helix repeat (20 copies)
MMFSAMRRRLHLSPATVIAGLALVFAMSGGAYAAKKYLITSTKQISPSVLKQLQGKAGAAGAPGVAGAQGAQGAQGPAGPAGPAGSNGTDGKTGEKGVQGATGAKGATGATGVSGATGFTETLPSGKTEYGNWDSSAYYPGSSLSPFAISFPIPIAKPSEHVVYLDLEETEESTTTPKEGCELEVENPAAKPTPPPAGTLCVFTRLEEGSAKFVRLGLNGFVTSDQPAGTFIWLETAEAGIVNISGTWAVTEK